MNARTNYWLLAPLLGVALLVGQSSPSAQAQAESIQADLRLAQGPLKSFHLYATDGEHPTADGAAIYIWGYSLTPQPGSATLPAPTIEVNEGDFVEITLTNLGPSRLGVHEFPHTIHLHGLDVDQTNDGVPETGPSVRVGQSFTYRFIARHAGTYWYHCHVDTVEHLTMGMYGALVVHPADGSARAWTDGPRYDRAYTLLLSEVDPRWSETIGENRTPDRTTFQPRYFFINGRSFPDTMDNADTHLMGYPGDRLLVRLINAGYQWRSMHLHGFHFEVIASDGRPLPVPYLKDTISLGPGERYDLLVYLNQLGSYPFHSHVVLDNLNDGDYPGGIHTMLTVVPVGAPLDPLDHDHLEGAGEEPVLPVPGAPSRGAAPTGNEAVTENEPAPEPASEPAPEPTAEAAPEPASARSPFFGRFGFGARPPAQSADSEPDEVAAAGHAGHELTASGDYLVEMRGDRFFPEFLVVPAGATVTWVNADPRTHSLASDQFAQDVRRNGSFSHTYAEPGTYQYECLNHRSMSGVITVR